MAKYEATENKPKRRSRAGIVLLVLLLIVAGFGGYLYYSVFKVPFVPDDPKALAAAAPMSAGERFQVSAADRTVQVRMDTGDIWSLILAHAGDDFLEKINEALSPYDLSVSGCAIDLSETELQVKLELFYQDTRFVANAPCSLEVSGNSLRLIPTGVELGKIRLPVQSLLSAVKLEYDLILPVISEMTQVSFTDGAIVLTGPMGEDFHTLVPGNKNLYWSSVFCEELGILADARETEEGFTALLQQLEQDPESLETVYEQLFTLADPKKTEAYLQDRHGMTQRFFPKIRFSSLEAEYTALMEQLNPMKLSLEQFFTKLVGDYNDKKFKLSDGVFYLKKDPFQAAKYGGEEYSALFACLDPESFFLVLVDAKDGFIRNTSSFYRMADENQQFTQAVDFNKTYILGCVFRSTDGKPFLLYDAEIEEGNSYFRSMQLVPLTEAEAAALQEPGKFGVWTDK